VALVGDKIEINCVCEDKSETLIWRFSDGRKVPQSTEKKNTSSVYLKCPTKNLQARKKGSTLVVPQFSADLNQSVFRCQRLGDERRNADPKLEVTLFFCYKHVQQLLVDS